LILQCSTIYWPAQLSAVLYSRDSHPKRQNATGNFTTGHISAYHTKHPVLLGHEETCKETSIVAFNHLTESRAAVCGARTEERKTSYKIDAHSFQKTYTYIKSKYQIHSTAARAPKAAP
jgi:hypothetical protein